MLVLLITIHLDGKQFLLDRRIRGAHLLATVQRLCDHRYRICTVRCEPHVQGRHLPNHRHLALQGFPCPCRCRNDDCTRCHPFPRRRCIRGRTRTLHVVLFQHRRRKTHRGWQTEGRRQGHGNHYRHRPRRPDRKPDDHCRGFEHLHPACRAQGHLG